MRRLFLCLLIMQLCILPVMAVDIEAPEAPESAQAYLPDRASSFSEDLWYILKTALSTLRPGILEAAGVCLSIVAVVLLVSLTENLSSNVRPVVDMVGTLGISALLFGSVNSLIHLGVNTVEELSQYGKLLLPVMTAGMAAQGGVTASGTLYTGTAFFGAVLSSVIHTIAVPLLYIFLSLSIANSAIGEKVLKGLRDFGKWAITWILKLILYVFTGYIAVTGVVSGATDASALKAAKLAISGAVPVVGGILSDASEAILVGAGAMKSAAGVYGILAMIAICIGPFLRIGVQYLMLKLTGAVCGVFGTQKSTELLQDFSNAMGLVLAMTGTVCLLQLISTVCFMKGVG